ncbi:hypothetical protein E2C01_003483 [Portunus trituberculatus]|uniref:Uncharacterized protein n=1 Tax=Portunus trituberculatus TaxID=210409 RepID=A0A5B7CMY9_PORTR|nr:hypothetical protein [Portunus trituberculatus]
MYLRTLHTDYNQCGKDVVDAAAKIQDGLSAINNTAASPSVPPPVLHRPKTSVARDGTAHLLTPCQ